MVISGDSSELEKDFAPLLARFSELESKLNPDLLATAKLRLKVQLDLNEILERLGFNKRGIMHAEGGGKDVAGSS